LTSWNVDPAVQREVLLAVSELATNVVLHGSPSPRRLDLEARARGPWLHLTLVDDGGPFADFEARLRAAEHHDLAASESSGLGLPLVADALPRLRYQPGPPNVLRAWRRLTMRLPTAVLVEPDRDRRDAAISALRGVAKVLTAANVDAAEALVENADVDFVVLLSDPVRGLDGGKPAPFRGVPAVYCGSSDSIAAAVRAALAETGGRPRISAR
jgi:anti-sigma regulatory factor (Ser/Thr protein kinase)